MLREADEPMSPDEQTEAYPVVVRRREFVAVRWTSGGPWHVLASDGTVTERFTLSMEASAGQLLFRLRTG